MFAGVSRNLRYHAYPHYKNYNYYLSEKKNKRGREDPLLLLLSLLLPCFCSHSPALVHVCQLSFSSRSPAHPLTRFRSPILVHRSPALVHRSRSRSPALPRSFTTVPTHWLPRSSPPRCIPPPSPFSLGPARLCTSHSWLHQLVRPCAFVLLWCVFRARRVKWQWGTMLGGGGCG